MGGASDWLGKVAVPVSAVAAGCVQAKGTKGVGFKMDMKGQVAVALIGIASGLLLIDKFLFLPSEEVFPSRSVSTVTAVVGGKAQSETIKSSEPVPAEPVPSEPASTESTESTESAVPAKPAHASKDAPLTFLPEGLIRVDQHSQGATAFYFESVSAPKAESSVKAAPMDEPSPDVRPAQEPAAPAQEPAAEKPEQELSTNAHPAAAASVTAPSALFVQEGLSRVEEHPFGATAFYSENALPAASTSEQSAVPVQPASTSVGVHSTTAVSPVVATSPFFQDGLIRVDHHAYGATAFYR